jgi:hypothetical protein
MDEFNFHDSIVYKYDDFSFCTMRKYFITKIYVKKILGKIIKNMSRNGKCHKNISKVHLCETALHTSRREVHPICIIPCTIICLSNFHNSLHYNCPCKDGEIQRYTHKGGS